jgi:hypothetical protein
MASLTGCIKKAREFLHPEDKAAVLAHARELRNSGLSNADAARQAVSARIEHAKGLLSDLEVQPSSKPVTEGAGTLGAGINTAAIKGALTSPYTPYQGVAPIKTTAHPLWDSLQKVFAPASRGPIASIQAGIMRHNWGKIAHAQELAIEALKESAAVLHKMPVAEQLKMADAIERGTRLTDPRLAAIAADLKASQDAKVAEVRALGTGALEHVQENYLTHLWQNPEKAVGFFGRRPLEGSKTSLKKRTIPYISDGMRWRAYDADGEFVKSFDTEAQAKAAAGADGRVGEPLKLVTTNPVELVMLNNRILDNFISGQKIFQEMKSVGIAKFVKFLDDHPAGWTKINDSIARVLQKNEGEGGGMILRGEYYAPDEAATLLNNHLSPGLRGNTFFEKWRMLGNMMVQLKMGLSGFHAGFTTFDAIINKGALGLQQISRGDIAKGSYNIAQAYLNPFTPIANVWRGDRVIKAYLGKNSDPAMAPIIEAMEKSNTAIGMDPFYRNLAANAFKNSIKEGSYGKASVQVLPYVLDKLSAPLFEWLVPRQKLGVFAELAKDWNSENPNASLAEQRKAYSRISDDIDNRMGQMRYDNRFWNRALKDGLMASIQAPGWFVGTEEVFRGGVLDIKDIHKLGSLSNRTAYLINLFTLTAWTGAVLTYLYTGEVPRDLWDSLHPRNGKTNPDGTEQRLSLATYVKDSDAVTYEGVGKYLKNRIHPAVIALIEGLQNKDWQDAAIRTPSDPISQQLIDEGKDIVSRLIPIGISKYAKTAKEEGKEPSFSDLSSYWDYATSGANWGLAVAPGYIQKSPEQRESNEILANKDAVMQKYRVALREGKMEPDEARAHMLKFGITTREIQSVIRSANRQPGTGKLREPDPDALDEFNQQGQ